MLPRPMKPIACSAMLRAPRTRRRPARSGGRSPVPRRDRAVQPGVFRRRGFERHGGAEIIRRDGSTVSPRLSRSITVGRAVAQAAIGHADRRAVVGLQHDAHIQRGHPVRAADDPVGPARQHLAAQPRPLEPAAGHQADRGGCPIGVAPIGCMPPTSSVILNRCVVWISAIASSRCRGRLAWAARSDPIPRPAASRRGGWREASGETARRHGAALEPARRAGRSVPADHRSVAKRHDPGAGCRCIRPLDQSPGVRPSVRRDWVWSVAPGHCHQALRSHAGRRSGHIRQVRTSWPIGSQAAHPRSIG